jgi:hypothetical protein
MPPFTGINTLNIPEALKAISDKYNGEKDLPSATPDLDENNRNNNNNNNSNDSNNNNSNN